MPERNLPVCANSELTYTFGSDTGILYVLLQEDVESVHVTLDKSSDLNTVQSLGPFSVKLTEVNGLSLIVTATSPRTNSSHQDLRLILFDGKTPLAKDVTVAGTVRSFFVPFLIHHICLSAQAHGFC